MPALRNRVLILPNTAKVAIVAALEREVRPLIKQWRPVEREYDGRKFKFFENERAVLVCGGIGPEAARRATEAIIKLYAPVLVQSVGFAGALDSTLKAGTVLTPICVIDAKDGSRIEAGVGHWVLVSVDHPASVEEKAAWPRPTGRMRSIWKRQPWPAAPRPTTSPSSGSKPSRDEADFEMPPIERFIAERREISDWGFYCVCGCSSLALAARVPVGRKQHEGSIRALRLAGAIQP